VGGGSRRLAGRRCAGGGGCGGVAASAGELRGMPGPRAHALLRRGPGSPAGEEEKERGVGQEKKPCVIAPLRPLSNDGQTNHIHQSGGAQGLPVD
jgi:hypothetical protein